MVLAPQITPDYACSTGFFRSISPELGQSFVVRIMNHDKDQALCRLEIYRRERGRGHTLISASDWIEPIQIDLMLKTLPNPLPSGVFARVKKKPLEAKKLI